MYIKSTKHLKRIKRDPYSSAANKSGLEQSDTLISKVEYLKRTEQKRLNAQVHLQDFYDCN